ncbi:MAG: alpha amylase C-terminal domain-containing protein, partial [Ruminococcus sp.]|nr:alpha amylase C-terminal domain-containing protein [Ruminococcus sp.]
NMPALHNGEYDRSTFRWLMADNDSQNFYVYMRSAENQDILCAFNFSGSEQTVRLNADKPWVLTPLLHSDEQTYSGTVKHEDILPIYTRQAIDGEIFELTLPRFSAVMFEVKEQIL